MDVRRSTPEKWFNNTAVSGGLQPYLVWLTISFVLKQWVITVEQYGAVIFFNFTYRIRLAFSSVTAFRASEDIA